MDDTRENGTSGISPTSHGGTVRGAMSPLERRLTFGVMALNLALAGWFLSRADFSGVLPNAAGYVRASEPRPAPAAQPESQRPPMLIAGSDRPIE